jgi:hypothetical protein
MTLPCPGLEEREDDKWYQKFWAMVQAKLFIVIPLVAVAAAAVGWWIYCMTTGRYGYVVLFHFPTRRFLDPTGRTIG